MLQLSVFLTVAVTLGALLANHPVRVGLVAFSGIAAAVISWVIWVENNGGFHKYSGEVWMGLMGAYLITIAWLIAVLVGVVGGTAFDTLREVHGQRRQAAEG
jgi:uncharacterized membrane protein